MCESEKYRNMYTVGNKTTLVKVVGRLELSADCDRDVLITMDQPVGTPGNTQVR